MRRITVHLIEVHPGYYVNPEHITQIKRSSALDKTFVGLVDGHMLVPTTIEDVISKLAGAGVK